MNDTTRINTLQPVQRRLLIPMTAILLLLVVGFGAVLIIQFRSHLHQNSTAMLSNAVTKLDGVLREQSAMLSALEDVILRDKGLRSALAAGDRERLLADWGPVFEQLRQAHGINHFFFHGPDRVNLLRLHKPEMNGDLIDRFTALQAERSGQTASGIELGPLGTFTLRVVRPVFDGETLIGYLELGKEIEDALAKIHEEKQGIELALAIHKSVLNRTGWESGMKMLGRDANWNRYGESVLIYSSLDPLPAAFDSFILESWRQHGEVTADVTFNKRQWQVVISPQKDVSGTDVGHLIVLVDTSANVAAFRLLLAVALPAGLLVIAGLLMFVYVMLRRTDTGIRAQQAVMREREERWSALTGNFEGIIQILDTDGTIEFMSKVYPLHTMEDVVGKSVFDFMDEASADKARQALKDVIAGLRTPAFEIGIQLPDGAVVPFEVKYVSQLRPDGSVENVISLITDITERKQAEAALFQEKKKAETYLDIAETLFIALDKEGNVILANKKSQKVLGYDESEILGKNWFDNFVPEEIASIIKPVSAQLMRGEIEPTEFFENPILTKSGEERLIAWHNTIIRNEAGEIIGHLSSGEDITERTQADEALANQKVRLTYILQGTDVGTWEWNVQTGETIFNERWADIIGYTLDEISPVSIDVWIKFTHPDDLKESDGLLQACFDGRADYYHCECRMHHKNGEWIWVLDRGKVVTWTKDGKPEWMYGTHQDITERKQAEVEKEKLESQLRQAQKMEAVGRLAGGVAHDFNNMLGIILGYADIILMQMDTNQPFHAELTEIRNAGMRSADLTRQLLAFARKQVVAPKVIDLNKTVAGMTRMLQRLIGEDIDLMWVPDDKLWPVKIDPSQIDQILANLCINARDAIVDVGKVTIETGNTVFDKAYCKNHAGFIPGDYVLLVVSDNGCGMDSETLENAFEPFFTTKEMGKGTGLGLATVYGAVKQNQGFINIYSEPGQGTTFKIYLPRHLAKAVPLPDKGPDTPVKRGHETILLVEDEPAILEVTTVMLESEGYSVVAAGAPGEAIELAHTHSGNIHLLMTDVVMPEMNGRDLAKNILSYYPNIKRLFMSGYTANVIAHHGVLDEGVNFIQKPFSMKDLTVKVREVLEQE